MKTIVGFATALSMCMFVSSSTGQNLPPADLTPGQSWIHPLTKKSMILVPTRTVRPNPKPLESGTVNMQKLFDNDGTQEVGWIKPYISQFDNRSYFVTGFLMDKDEVTNEEFMRFCKATQAAFPSSWKGSEPSPEKMEKTVFVSYEAAEKYAEWAGMRLPYIVEYNSAVADDKGVYPWTLERIGGTNNTAKAIPDRSPLGIESLAEGIEWVSGKFGGQWARYETRILYEFRYADDGTINILQPRVDCLVTEAGFRCVSALAAVSCMLAGKQVGGGTQTPIPDNFVTSSITVKNQSTHPAELALSTGQKLPLTAGQESTLDVPIGSHVLMISHHGIPQPRFWFSYLDAAQGFSWPPKGVSGTWTITDDFGYAIPLPKSKD
ncbi:MAG TPA: SUMF1/EgtB/PvdO family nonheme iron enzyme [Verrucomicrobiae bacterium]|nr:SUMF1/EgtB/PvdO family nonheme iron enzyme [Verrucomicrobiae bacterium]